jgi:hypothetical protein
MGYPRVDQIKKPFIFQKGLCFFDMNGYGEIWVRQSFEKSISQASPFPTS